MSLTLKNTDKIETTILCAYYAHNMRKHRKNYNLNHNEAYTMKNIIKKHTTASAILDRIVYVSFCFHLLAFFIVSHTYAETDITTPDIQLVNITIEKVTFTSMDVYVELDIYNPNEFALAVSSLTYSLKVNGALILSDEVERKEIFLAKKSRRISIPASLPYDENFASVLKLLNQSTDINYSVFGNIQLDNQVKPLSFLHNGIINPSTYIKKNINP